jgi:hypothetical protein
MHVLIYVAGFLLWPILFGALAGRLLGVEVGRVRGARCADWRVSGSGLS